MLSLLAAWSLSSPHTSDGDGDNAHAMMLTQVVEQYMRSGSASARDLAREALRDTLYGDDACASIGCVVARSTAKGLMKQHFASDDARAATKRHGERAAAILGRRGPAGLGADPVWSVRFATLTASWYLAGRAGRAGDWAAANAEFYAAVAAIHTEFATKMRAKASANTEFAAKMRAKASDPGSTGSSELSDTQINNLFFRFQMQVLADTGDYFSGFRDTALFTAIIPAARDACAAFLERHGHSAKSAASKAAAELVFWVSVHTASSEHGPHNTADSLVGGVCTYCVPFRDLGFWNYLRTRN